MNKELLSWADVIIPIGGDGTFLLAAGRANPLFSQIQHKIPVVGFNSDPKRSEGRLMLPKHYSSNPEDAVKQIKCVSFIFYFSLYKQLFSICFIIYLEEF